MIFEFQRELAKLERKLLQLERSGLAEASMARQGLILCLGTLQAVQKRLMDYAFVSHEREVQFFKESYPSVYKRFLYFHEVYRIEFDKPMQGIESTEKYYQEHRNRIGRELETYRFIHQYIQDKDCSQDAILFTRKGKPDIYSPWYRPDVDPRLSAPGTEPLSRYYALEMVYDYLEDCLEAIRLAEVSRVSESDPLPNHLYWTDTKSALIELVYALHLTRSINHGKQGLRQLMSQFELVFQMPLGNFYRCFQNMRFRKQSNRFLERLSEALRKQLEGEDK